MCKLYILVLSLLKFAYSSQVQDAFVSTSLGTIQGLTMLSRNGNKFNAFLGVPFVKPPVGDLRFQNPVPLTQPWGALNATQYAPICVQPLQSKTEGSEDCLYLNIYTPKIRQEPLPVWVFIYGGKKLFGDSAPHKYGPEYIMEKPVILITLSYRLGPFGFLSTEDETISGNFGLKDETAAFEWIQRHISSFGGDPNNVTISGGSSGAIDVGFHILSPLSKGLFHKAISQSGHPLNSDSIHEPGEARKLAWRLASVVGCNTPEIRSSEALLKCLRHVPSNKLGSAFSALMHDYILPFMVFGPVIEQKNTQGAFLTESPCRTIGQSNTIPWLIGGISDEGTQRTLTLFSKQKYLTHFEKHYKRLLPEFLRFKASSNTEHMVDVIKEKYMPHKTIQESFYELSQVNYKIYGFGCFHLGTIDTVLRYKGKLYLYMYDYANRFGYKKTYFMLMSAYSKYKIGAVHGEELVSLFYNPVQYPPVLEGDDRIVSDQVITFWYNFVAFGDPNGKSKKKLWQPVSSSDLEYLYIGNHTFEMRNKYNLGEEYEFWKDIGSPTLCELNSV